MMNDEWHKHLIITLSNARRKAAAAAAVAGEILQLYLQATIELDALNYRAGCRPLMTQSFAFNHSSDAAAALSTKPPPRRRRRRRPPSLGSQPPSSHSPPHTSRPPSRARRPPPSRRSVVDDMRMARPRIIISDARRQAAVRSSMSRYSGGDLNPRR